MSGNSTPYFLLPVQPTPTQLYRRESLEGELIRAKRVRASKPKVKSGCITCKARRVKCDETKPHCRRCQKFGRVCDGYPEPPSAKVAVVPIKPRIPSVSIYNPSVSIHTSEDESRYFQVFMDHSANELSGFLDPSFWTRLVLQESHIVPPIRHAVIAIGALNKSLESAPRPNLKVNIIQSIDKKHHENAVLQYLKAIQALNNYITESDSPQLRTALVACLLFICFETFQGSYASSVQQTYGGLKILRSYYQGKPGSKPWIPPRSGGEFKSKAIMSGKISKELQSRLGCDNVSKTRAIAMHLDEYLEADDGLHTDSEGHITAIKNAFNYEASVDQHEHPNAMTGTTAKKEQQRTIMALSARRHSTYSVEIADGQIREAITDEAQRCEMMRRQASQASQTSDNFRNSSATSNSTIESSTSSARKSSTFSNSSVSTPITYTPPSTGPHTPSQSYAPPSQALTSQATPTQTLSTSRKRPLASRSPTPPPLHNDFAIEEILIQTFVRVDGQGLFFGMIPGIPPLIWDIHETWHLPIPSSFDSFASAHRCWDFLQDRALQFFRRTSFNRAYAPASLDPPDKIQAELAEYLRHLEDFRVAFQPVLDEAVAADGTIKEPAALLLSLYQKITVITLAAVPSESEMVYDVFLPDFRYIVRACAKLIGSHNTTKMRPSPRFTFEVGIVPPLHVTATKCRDPVVRREAVELLFESPRQEGMWDGVLSARIGKWICSCEEDGLDLGSLNSSRQSSVSQSSSPRGSDGRSSYPSPPPLMEGGSSTGAWEDGRRISDIVNEVVPPILNEIDGNNNSVVSSTRAYVTSGGRKKSMGKMKGRELMRKGWVVPEENRVRLMVVDFHFPERYIKVKCQKALLRPDGTREERETVIAW